MRSSVISAPVSSAEIVPFRNTIYYGATYPADRHYYSVAIDNQTMWAGPAVGWQATPRLSLGLSVFGAYQTHSSLMNFYWGDEALAQAGRTKQPLAMWVLWPRGAQPGSAP